MAAFNIKAFKTSYLAMEMRTGKTLTALYIAELCGAKRVLFFTKKKALSSIQKDYDLLQPSYQFKCLNYDKLAHYTPTDSNGDPCTFSKRNFEAAYLSADFVILDESHCLGQYPIKANKVSDLKKICKGLPILYLSGSPSPESYSQLYHQFYISSFSPFLAWKTFYDWSDEFVDVRQKYFFNRSMNDYSAAKQDLIFDKIKHLFLTMTQQKAGFESKTTDVILNVKMADSTYYLIKKLLKDRIYKGADGSVVLADTEVKLMSKIHQICSGTVKCEPVIRFINGSDTLTQESKCFDHTKAKFIKEHFAGKKIAIMYVFKEELNMLQWAYGFDNLTDDPVEFAATNKTFCAQVISTREGVDLSAADCIVMLNIGFPALSYIQARERMQSKERTLPCVVYWIFADGGIEQKIYDRVINKLDYTISYFREDYL